MSCERPLTIVNPRYKGLTDEHLFEIAVERYGLHIDKPPDYIIEVPCGKCFSCQKKRLQGYRFRLLHELEQSKTALFVTLTFCDSALHEYKDNYNKAVCQFMDSLRKKYGKELRHFFCMEYGSEDVYLDKKGRKSVATKRPHFHGLIFGLPYLDFYVFESVWNRGNGRLRHDGIPFDGFYKKPRGVIWLESVREPEKCASYVCKYLTKEYSKDYPTPRVLTSVGLGAGYLTPKNVAFHKNNLDTTITLYGLPFSLPLYYRNKIFDKDDKVKIVLKRYYDTSPFVRVVDGREYYDYKSYVNARHRFHERQKSLGLSPRPKRPEIKQPKVQSIPDLFEVDFHNPDFEFFDPEFDVPF